MIEEEGILHCEDCDDWRPGVTPRGRILRDGVRGTCVYRLRDSAVQVTGRRRPEPFWITRATDPCVHGRRKVAWS